MAYTKTVWKDRVIQRPNTFNLQNNADGTITLIPVPGTVTEAGTLVNAANLNKIEGAIYNLDSNKVDIISGKGLSTNDYDNTAKAEVAKIAAKADKTYVDNEFANKAIVESGSNQYGRYIKFGDGTMICSRRFLHGEFAFTTKQTEMVYGYYNPDVTFPQPFVGGLPSVSLNLSSNGLLIAMYSNLKLNGFSIRAWSQFAGTHTGLEYSYTAIGRWK